MPRPSEGRTEYLRVRLTPEEMAQLKADADIAAVDVSTLARAQLMNAPMPKRRYRRSADHAILGEVLKQVSRLGTNLNQLAKVANSNGDLTPIRNARALQTMLEEIRDLVRSALTP